MSYTEGDPERYLPPLALADGGLSEDESTADRRPDTRRRTRRAA